MTYRERLTAPATWWIVAAFFGLTTATALGFYLGPAWAVGIGIVAAIGMAAALVWIGSVAVVVDERGLSVGRYTLEWAYLGDVETLDAEQTRARLGPEADARALVVQRPYVAESVVVGVRDEADPHPYWLVSTRSPAQLAAAVQRLRPEASA